MNQAVETHLHDARSLSDCLQCERFLGKLKREELERLFLVMKKKAVPAGTTVYKAGDKADAFYLVASGKLGVWHATGFQSRQVATVGEGQYFGDNSLLSDKLHHNSVVALSNCQLYVLHREDFEQVLMGNPDIANSIKAHVAQVRRADRG